MISENERERERERESKRLIHIAVIKGIFIVIVVLY
jgi:hypothetical protein